MADSKHKGSSLDSLLEADGTLCEFQAKAINETIAWQIRAGHEKRNLSKLKLTDLIDSSRVQVDRISDPEQGT